MPMKIDYQIESAIGGETTRSEVLDRTAAFSRFENMINDQAFAGHSIKLINITLGRVVCTEADATVSC